MILNKRISVLLLLIGLASNPAAFAQQMRGAGNTGGTFVSGKAGISYLTTEIFHDYSDIVQFSNRPGLYGGFDISLFFIPALEAGAGFSWSVLNGHAETADLSVLGSPFDMGEPQSGAVDYNVRLYGPEVFAYYHFGRNIHSPGSLNFFIKAGAGFLFYEMELLFTDRVIHQLIFGNNYQPDRNSNMVYTLGGGLSYGISEMIRLKLAANMNWMDFELPDVLQNFDAGSQQSVSGAFTIFSAGLSIKLNQQKARQNKPGFPFAP